MGATLSYPTVDLTDKVVVITGGNAGIGYETAKTLAVMGAHTIIACRSEEKAQTAIEQMKQEISVVHPDKTISLEFMKLDLASFKSTKDFALAFKEKNMPLHILINNAGMRGPPLTMTEDGNEIQFQVNHLSHFLLTLELLPTILDTAARTGDCRILILSSTAHKSGVFDPANLNGEKNYGSLNFYNNSKLFNVMHGFSLQRRLQNVGITVSSIHPGVVDTQLFNEFTEGSGGKKALFKVAKFALKPMFRNPQKGAATSINCAVNRDLNKQQHLYYADCSVTPPIPASANVESQEQLWEISVNKVRDWLSPEILERYGTRMSPVDLESEASGDQSSVTVPPAADTTTPTEKTDNTTPINESDNTTPTNGTKVVPTLPSDDIPANETTPINVDTTPTDKTEKNYIPAPADNKSVNEEKDCSLPPNDRTESSEINN